MELPTLPLKGGVAIPPPENPFNPALVNILTTALVKHYVHPDCANSYGTERELAAAIKASGLPRESLFKTTKVQDGWADVPAAMGKSLKNLELDYIDLLTMKASGKARAIGVSNMQRNHIETILETPSEIPAINKIEYHPYLQQVPDDRS
ncbi:hypothetical protein KVR01_005174 [Diaporthe batatas]|uniref:uncharacterized protein n=1 Tax=Diaporthe batatas TaxID=748121 RepID=UPI001D036992|nr:uncharacterized protein KVR01_005174 [Diaporthe batatas]KAG8164899.1 hypothetical protein KVR01_005174 [Diaporthe batatas]